MPLRHWLPDPADAQTHVSVVMDAPALLPVLPAGRQFELDLASRRESCEEARLALEQFLAPWELDAAATFAIELVLEEVLMNIIWHAGAATSGDPEPIHLVARVQDDAIVLCFEDKGIAFDPTHAAEPVVPASLDDARPGGLGIALVRKFARSLVYERAGPHNRLTVSVAR
jgi:anti-sigma regulatory factor (Ser/Thr protein kinase)